MDVSPLPVEAVIEIVNGWSSTVRAEAGEGSTSYPDLADLLPADREFALAPDGQLADIAQRLFAVFSSRTPTAKLEALNSAIRALDPTPVVSDDGPRWAVREQGTALEAALLLALAEHAREDLCLGRLGTCDADRCCDVYVDASQAETRRFCSLKCQNRAKVSQHRRRQRTANSRSR